MSDTKPSQDERIMAALAHACAILFGMGIVGAIVIWATQKDRSRYVAFQALQAIVYQIAGLVVTMASWCCWTALYFASFIPLMSAAEAGAEPPFFFWFSMLLMFVPLAIMGLWILGGLWGALRCLRGHDFTYIVVGNWLEGQR